MNLCDPSVIRMLMNHQGVQFRHDFGQNFLIDVSVPMRIAEYCCDDEDSLILEIGPGIGCLTQELAKIYRKVVSVEIDKGLIPILKETLSEYTNVSIHNADFLKTDVRELLNTLDPDYPDRKISVCANLPYYITTPILMELLESGIPYQSITIMIQKEVADRLLADPGSKDYGAITAVLGYYGTVKKLFSVNHSCFIPAPKVDSVVVRLDLHAKKPYHVENEKFFFSILRGAFEMRRKTLQNAISSKCSNVTKDMIVSALNEMGLDPLIRGERLSTEQFATLSNLLYKMKEINEYDSH